MNETKKKEMEALIKALNEASSAYYNGGTSSMSDREWDAMFDQLKKMEEEILTLVDANKEGALEKALVFYGYLNELPEDELLSGNYSHEKIKKGLKMVAEHYGILNVIDLMYR